MNGLYLENGYLNFDRVLEKSSTLNVIIGPRNSGKTYSGLKSLLTSGDPYTFIRTTKTQIDTVFTPSISPFTALNRDLGTRFTPEHIPKSSLIGVYDDYTINEKTGKVRASGNLCGYCFALSQVGSIRGFDMYDVKTVIYDEFILHPGEIDRTGGKQFTMYADVIYTINRSRELAGQPPVKQFLFGNSDNLGNDILSRLNLVDVIIRMIKARENYVRITERDISIFLLTDSPAAARMREVSALSRIFGDTEYNEMALSNSFVYDDLTDCRPQPIAQYIPLFAWGNLLVMRSRAGQTYYVRELPAGHRVDGVPVYSGDGRGAELVRQRFFEIYHKWLAGLVLFDRYPTKLLFIDLYKIDKNTLL